MRSLAGIETSPIKLASWFWYALAGAVLLIAAINVALEVRKTRREADRFRANARRAPERAS